MTSARPRLLLAVFLLTPPSNAGAAPLQCLGGQDGSGNTLRGPCEFLDSMNVLFGGPWDVTLVANFGLLARDPAGVLRYRCEEALGGLAWRARPAADGGWLVATAQGVLRHEPDVCPDRPHLVPLDGREALDLLVADSDDPVDDRARVWALTAAPAALYLSADGGRRFTRGFQFAAGEQPLKLVRAPAAAGSPRPIYAAGEDATGRLLVRRSDDGGVTFAPAGGAPPPGIPLDLLGVSPRDPGTLFAAVRVAGSGGSAGEHDEVWRSRDGGGSWQRSLALPPSEGLGGFSFAADGSALYLGTRELLLGAASAPARLFVSRDGGETWEPPLPSPRNGPRFRCLAARGDQLFACAGGEPNGDDFLLGVSGDGGRSWAPLITVNALAGPEPCLRAPCLPTTEWLCAVYGVCEGRTRDGGPADGGPGTEDVGGCSCTLAGGPPAGAPALALLAGIAGLIARTRRRRSITRTSTDRSISAA